MLTGVENLPDTDSYRDPKGNFCVSFFANFAPFSTTVALAKVVFVNFEVNGFPMDCKAVAILSNIVIVCYFGPCLHSIIKLCQTGFLYPTSSHFIRFININFFI
jgi:hypothetical protein